MNSGRPGSAALAEHVSAQLARAESCMQIPSDIAISVKGLDSRYQEINKSMSILIGDSVENIIGKTDADFFPTEISAWVSESCHRITEGANSVSREFELTVGGVSGRFLWIEFPLLADTGAVNSIGTAIVDLSKSDAMAAMQNGLKLLQEANEKLKTDLVELGKLAGTDKLTGAWNRHRFEESVANEIDRLKRYGHPLSVLMVDIDHFKAINDTFGHGVGDQVLTGLAAVIRSSLRSTDALTRWGGEEFVVLGPCTTLSTMAILAERLRERIAQAAFPHGKQVSVSIGVAECLPDELWVHFLERADAALYKAKENGRNRIHVDRQVPSRPMDHSEGVASFVQLSWHSAYDSGNSLIDDEHRTLFLDANNLISAILSQKPKEQITSLINALMHDTIQHFREEEEILARAGYPGLNEHAELHRHLIESGAALVQRYQSGEVSFGELFQYLARDVIAKHLLRADRAFFPYLNLPA